MVGWIGDMVFTVISDDICTYVVKSPSVSTHHIRGSDCPSIENDNT